MKMATAPLRWLPAYRHPIMSPMAGTVTTRADVNPSEPEVCDDANADEIDGRVKNLAPLVRRVGITTVTAMAMESTLWR